MARILVVEDSENLRFLFVEALIDATYDVVEAANGEIAATLLKDQRQLDALSTDVNMPGAVNGLGVGQQFRALFPEHPSSTSAARPTRSRQRRHRPTSRRGVADTLRLS